MNHRIRNTLERPHSREQHGTNASVAMIQIIYLSRCPMTISARTPEDGKMGDDLSQTGPHGLPICPYCGIECEPIVGQRYEEFYHCPKCGKEL